MKKLTFVMLALGLGVAAAQETAAPSTPAVSTTVPPQILVSRDLSGVLEAPRKVKGEFEVKLSIRNVRAEALELQAARNNAQNCAYAPLVRVLAVGTREVVYPVAGEPKMCSQDMQTQKVDPNETVTFTRTLNLPAGDYMIENWFTGLVNGELLKIPGTPVRVTVGQ